MDFVSSRELRLNPGPILKRVGQGGREVVLTSHGKPVALLVGVDSEDLEETLRAFRRARAQIAASRMRRTAQQRELDTLSPEQIESEIRSARAERQGK